MESVENGLLEKADNYEKLGETRKAIRCLKMVIHQSEGPVLPIVEVKARLCLGAILLKHFPNHKETEAHLKRAMQLLLECTPSCFELKCIAYTLLSQLFAKGTASESQKKVILKGLDLTATSADWFTGRLWFCNFNAQLANALIIEGDFKGSLAVLEEGYSCAKEMCFPELQIFFASSVLHVHLMQRDDICLVRRAFKRCKKVWKSLKPEKAQQCKGLMFYNDLLHVFYHMRIHKSNAQTVQRLDSAMKSDIEQTRQVQVLRKEFEVLYASLSRDELGYRDRSTLKRKRGELEKQLATYTGQVSANKDRLEPAYFGNTSHASSDKLELAPPLIAGQWLPERAVFALLELVAIVINQPKGFLEKCEKSIHTIMQTIREELAKLRFDDGAKEVDLKRSTIWMVGVYLSHLMHLLENKVAVDLTRPGFSAGQLGLLQMGNWNVPFPTILQACESAINMLRDQCANSVGCYSEATDHYQERKRQKESGTSLFAVTINGDAFFGGDGSTVSMFGVRLQESSMKVYELNGDFYALGAGNRNNVIEVTEEMRRLALAEPKKYQNVKQFAFELARLANVADLYDEDDIIDLIVIGRLRTQDDAIMYYVQCMEVAKGVKEYKCFNPPLTGIKGSGYPYMALFRDRPDQK